MHNIVANTYGEWAAESIFPLIPTENMKGDTANESSKKVRSPHSRL